MTTDQLYQPISSIFTKDEIFILPALCKTQAKRHKNYAHKANDSERSINMQRVEDHTQQENDLLQLAEQLQDGSMKVEDMKEEWIVEVLIKEINVRIGKCKEERAAFYQQLSEKIIDLFY